MESIRLDEEAVLKTVGRDERLVGASPTGSAWWNYPPTEIRDCNPVERYLTPGLKRVNIQQVEDAIGYMAVASKEEYRYSQGCRGAALQLHSTSPIIEI
jgi:hypothetical protein